MRPLGPGTSGGGRTATVPTGSASAPAGAAASFLSSFFLSSARVSQPVRGGSGARRSPRQAAIDCGRASMLSASARSIALRKPAR